VEVGLDRRQRYVHDRDVQHDHELGRHDHRQRQPATVALSGCCFCHNLGTHPLFAPIVDLYNRNQFERLRATVIP
jgi:hypothetical protein